MKFRQYLIRSSKDESEMKYRAFKFKLVKEKTGNEDIAKQLDPESVELLEKLNDELKKMYRGTYMFDFCINEGISPSELKKIKGKKMNKLTEKFIIFNDMLSQKQTEFERSLKDK